MSKQISVTVTGAIHAKRQLSRLAHRLIAQVLRRAMREGLIPIRDQARSNSPAKTGLLRDRITLRQKKRNGNIIGMEVVASVRHAVSAEDKHHFMRDAFDDHAETTAQLVSEITVERIESNLEKTANAK